MRWMSLLLLLVVMSTPATPLPAQSDSTLLRVELRNPWQRKRERTLVGTMLEPRAGCLNLRTSGLDRCIPVDSLGKVSVARGMRRQYMRSAVAGGLLGMILGGLLVAAASPGCIEGEFNVACGPGTGFAIGAVLGGGAGLVLGTLTAAIAPPTPNWRGVNPRSLIASTRRGPSVIVGLKTAF